MQYSIIVTLLKQNKIILFFFLPVFCFAQQECNKETFVKNEVKLIPKDVCIRKDYMIFYIYSKYQKIDFNEDGLADLVFSMRKKAMSLGDTTFLVFYKMNLDSSYTLVKEFNNIIPVYFDPNIEGPKLNNKVLIDLFDCYGIPNPLNHVDILNNTIEMIVNLDGQFYESIIYVYKFDKNKNDWLLSKKTYYQGNNAKALPIVGENTLSEFSYCEQTIE